MIRNESSHGILPTRNCTHFLNIKFVVAWGGFLSWFYSYYGKIPKDLQDLTQELGLGRSNDSKQLLILKVVMLILEHLHSLDPSFNFHLNITNRKTKAIKLISIVNGQHVAFRAGQL